MLRYENASDLSEQVMRVGVVLVEFGEQHDERTNGQHCRRPLADQ